MFTTFHTGQYQPLSWVTLGLDHLLWGMEPFGYHLTSLLLHAACAVLFYFVTGHLLNLRRSNPIASSGLAVSIAACFGALVFAMHPLRVEPVVWASTRDYLVSGLFLLWSLLCYLRAVKLPESHSKWLRCMTASVIIYGLSLLSKPIGITLPVILLLLDVYYLDRLTGDQGNRFAPVARRVWYEKIPFLLLALGALALTVVAQQSSENLSRVDDYDATTRIALMLYSLAFFLWQTVIPLGLSPLYEWPTHLDKQSWHIVLGGVMIVTGSVGIFLVRRRWPAGLVSWVSYVLILLGEAGSIAGGGEIAADRYTYLACLGWAVLAGAGVLFVWQKWHCGQIFRGAFAVTGLVTILLSLGIVTWKQTATWQDSETLWTSAVRSHPRGTAAREKLATVLVSQGALDKAIENFNKVVEINPNRGDIHFKLGKVWADLGRFDEAIDHFQRALKIDSSSAQVHYHLGRALEARGRLDEAIDHFQQALRIEPEFAEVHVSLGRALSSHGRYTEAVQHYQAAIRQLKSRVTEGVKK